MSQEISKWLVNGLFHLLINGVYWGYNPLILTIYYLPGTSKYVRWVGEKTHQPDTLGDVFERASLWTHRVCSSNQDHGLCW